jgi:CheY-like chemotaxis protein
MTWIVMARILVVEDDAALLDTLALALRRKGHTVVSAANGEEGIEKFAGTEFDLVVTDILMPGMDGFGAILEMKRSIPHTRILAISGGGQIVDYDFLAGASTLGASETLRKPFSLPELYEAVERCLQD